MESTGTNQNGTNIQATNGDLPYIDHTEVKLLSPLKETISPNKAFKEALTKDRNTDSSNKPPIRSIIEDANQKENAKSDPNESKNSDSGLDSSNNSGDSHDEKFIDRQESLVEVNEPESITSPNKMVDHLFNFIDSEAQQTLDAVNNNSEASVQCSQPSDDPTNVTVESYLGTEVSLHKRDKDAICVKDESSENKRPVNSQANLVPNATIDESEMNFYWYSSSLEVDPKELELFSTSQTETSTSTTNSYTSTIQMSVRDPFLNTSTNVDSVAKVEEKSVETTKPSAQTENKEIWSSAFESASSRFIGLASEMNLEPKDTKNEQNKTIKKRNDVDVSEGNDEQHPWGLQPDDRTMTESVSKTAEELPAIVSIPANNVNSTEMAVDTMDGVNVNQATMDVPDAIGYVEIKDKEQILKSQSIPVEANAKQDKHSLDTADAVGYMENNDKPQTKGKGKKGKNKKGKKQIVMDEADAVGYMDIVDKPTEEIIKPQASSELKSKSLNAASQVKTSGKGDSEQLTSTVAQGVESQVITQYEGDSKSDQHKKIKTEIGFDTPDGSKSHSEKQTTVEVELKRESTQLESVSMSKAINVELKTEPSKPIEVERKFRIANDSEQKIKKLGGKLITTETFTDEYLDNDCYSLTLDDSWLRLRNKKFEMKVNAAIASDSDKASVYNEVSNERDIKEFLIKKFRNKSKLSKKDEKKPLDVVIDELGLMEFATFQTTRKSYQLEKCKVDLDITDFGFQVGEIEVMVDSPRKVTEALEIIDSVSQQLGFSRLQGL